MLALTTRVAKELRSDDPAIGLAAVLALRELADEVEAAQVRQARRLGWSWHAIGASLGVTRQSVHKKHSRRVR